MCTAAILTTQKLTAQHHVLIAPCVVCGKRHYKNYRAGNQAKAERELKWDMADTPCKPH